MAKRSDTKAVRETIAALAFAGVKPKEIHRRLTENEAGLPYPVEIGLRTVHYHLQRWRAEVAAGDEPKPGAVAESIEALEQRALVLLSRELARLETKRPGSLTGKDYAKLVGCFRTLGAVRKQVAPRTRAKAAKPSSGGDTSGEDFWAKLAREEREAANRGAVPQGPNPLSTDDGLPSGSDASDNGTRHGEGGQDVGPAAKGGEIAG